MGVIIWPDADAETLRTRWAAGDTSGMIARALGNRYTRNGVIGKAHRMNLPMRDAAKQRTAQAARVKPPIKRARIIQIKDGVVAKDVAHPDNEPAPLGPIGDFPSGSGCRWPHGSGPTHQCCGHPIDPPAPYCSHHRARAWVSPNTTNQRVAK